MARELGTGASTAYAGNRYAPRTGRGPVGRSLSPRQIALVEKLTIELAQLSARMCLATPDNGPITRADLDALAAEIAAPAAIVASIQAQLNRTDVAANGDNGIVSLLIAQVNAKRAACEQIERRAGKSAPAAANGTQITEGNSYRHADGRVFSAYLTRDAGRLCLKLWNAEAGALDEEGNPRGEFQWFGGVAKAPAGLVEMTKEECLRFGQATGTCTRCRTYLTNGESIARGMGPVCFGKD